MPFLADLIFVADIVCCCFTEETTVVEEVVEVPIETGTNSISKIESLTSWRNWFVRKSDRS